MASQGSIRCARCCIVTLDTFSSIIQELIGFNTSATIVHKKIWKTKSFLDGLDSTQWHTIQTLLSSDGFTKLDFSLIYKIAKYFNLYIEPPTRQWGAAPLPNETCIGDDVERMRRARNNLFHRVEAEIREDEFNDFFTTFVQVGRRVDEYLSKPRNCGYEKSICDYQKCFLDTDIAEKYLKEREEKERLKALVDVQVPHEKIVHVLVGNTAREAINKVRKITDDDGSTSFKFIIHGIEDSTNQAEMLTALVQERNIRTENIEFVSATSECIALYINIRNKILKEESHFASEVSIFIQKLFMLEEIKFIDEEECNLVITSAEEDIHIEYSETAMSEETTESHDPWCGDETLVVNLRVKNKVLRTEDSLRENIKDFVESLLSHTNGSELIKKDNVIAVLAAENEERQIHDAGQQLQRNRSFDDMAVEHQNTDDAAMSCTGSVRGFAEFEDLCRGHQGYSTNLAELFDKVSCDKQKSHRHNITFKEALKRLKNKIKESFQELEVHTEREIREFTIGKTFVKSIPGVIFNTMKATTWSLGGRINGRWQDYKRSNYDGLIVIGCIERDTIPANVKETNKSIEMNQHTYTLDLEQGLIQHFALHKPDKRLRNRLFDPGNLSTIAYKGGIVYVAYKLEPKASYSDDETVTGTENVHGIVLAERQLAMNRLKLRLEREGLFFQDGIPLEGTSFFEACSSQLERVGNPFMDPIDLRHMVIQQLKLQTPDSMHRANFTKDRWNVYLNKLGISGEVVEDVVLEKMAKLLQREIIIYFTEYPEAIGSISINNEAAKNGTSLLLGRYKGYFQGICTKRTVTATDVESSDQKNPSVPEKKPRQMKRPARVDFDCSASSIKQFKQSSMDDNAMDEPEKHSSSIYSTYFTRSVSSGMTAKERKNIPQSSQTTQEKPKPILKKGTNQNVFTLAANLQKNEANLNFKSFVSEQLERGAMLLATPPSKRPAGKRVIMAKEEIKLILNSYRQQRIKSDFDQLVDTVYSQRHVELPREIINHYENTLTPYSRKNRIRKFINDCKSGKRNEKDPEINALIAEIVNTS